MGFWCSCIQDPGSKVQEPNEQQVPWLSRTRLVDEVADVLRSHIYAGTFALGMPLRQEQLAAQLNVSRTPLREALRILESEGLVRMEVGRSVRVISGDAATLLSAYEFREVVDGLAARLNALKQDGELFEQLESILERQGKAFEPWSPAAYTETNVDFHGALIRASGNKFLVAQLPVVHMTSQVFTPIARVEVRRAQGALEEHIEILAALRAGNAAMAERLARRHIRQTIRSLRSTLGTQDASTTSEVSDAMPVATDG